MESCAGIGYRSFRVLLTEACNASCPNCFNSLTRDPSQHMDPALFSRLCRYLAANGITALKIMGGEPTFHPDFVACALEARRHFSSRIVFTNGYDLDAINNAALKEGDTVVVNFRFCDAEMLKAAAGLPEALIVFEVQISSDCDPEAIRAAIHDADAVFGARRHAFKFTLDCTEDIFARRKTILEKWKIVSNGLGVRDNFRVDHAIPYCFIRNEGLTLPEGGSFCKAGCSGLIDSGMMLRHCNQYDPPLITVLQNGEFIPFTILLNHLAMARARKLATVLEKLCACCSHYGKLCNGGCFLHKTHIPRESILKSRETG